MKIFHILTVMAVLPAGGVAVAADPSLTIELNRLEAAATDACRVYMVISNPSEQAWRSLRLDLFAFDKAGVVGRRVAVDVGPVAAKKTSVKLFDFAGLPCERFSRVLLNDVVTCEPMPRADVTRPASCTDIVSPRSKVDAVAFDK